ncbi:MAG: NYN domain-containing protein [Prevotellaceae bacterium]|nr:NYN domain-containing protein [Prevotellaceae bacterium]
MKKDNDFPPVKIAVLIDGGFFVKRFNHLYNKDRKASGKEVADMLYTMAMDHVGSKNTLYRIFYYDCYPIAKKVHNPITGKAVDFSKTPEYEFKMDLLNALKKKRKVALRMGDLKDNNKWQIYPRKLKELFKGETSFPDLCEEDVYLDIRQKGIDMKIGVDIASLALKHFVDTIVLFAGDSDFVPASKLARREGVDFILDPMKANVDSQLFEHVDGVYNANLPHKKRVNRKRERTIKSAG